MITDKNYFTEIDRIGTSSLQDTLTKSHVFVVKSTNNGSSWDTYQDNDTIRKVMNATQRPSKKVEHIREELDSFIKQIEEALRKRKVGEDHL